jgi:hypothetical protein
MTMNNIVAETCRRHALAVSGLKRAGKFKRVSQEFLDKLEAEIQGVLHKLRSIAPLVNDKDFVKCEESHLLQGAFKRKIADEAEAALARLIQKHVQFHPSRGQTLQD